MAITTWYIVYNNIYSVHCAERVGIAFMENGSMKKLRQIKSYLRGEMKHIAILSENICISITATNIILHDKKIFSILSYSKIYFVLSYFTEEVSTLSNCIYHASPLFSQQCGAIFTIQIRPFICKLQIEVKIPEICNMYVTWEARRWLGAQAWNHRNA